MSDVSLNVYHRLPSFAQSTLASLRGRQLKSWRYGPETDRLVDDALGRERWPSEQWKSYQEERLAYVLHRAATQVPYYRDQWADRRRRGDRSAWDQLENWPILDKGPIHQNPRQFLVDGSNPRRMVHVHTSGTTGKPLELWRSAETEKKLYAMVEARWLGWYGVNRHDRWGMLGGQLVVRSRRRHPPFWVWNRALNQLYMSSYHLAPDLIPHYLNAMLKYRITYLYGYTSSMYALALEALRLGYHDVALAVAIANAEPIYEHQRETIATAFSCHARETYGMTERVAAASECEAGRLHLWPEMGWVECVEDGVPVMPGTAGELVCTGLLNADMPLIRYNVGDRGSLARDTSCPCGRTLPILESVEGRTDDVLFTADGRRIGRLDPVFKSDLPIREAQIIQETLRQVRVRIVPTSDYVPEAGQAIAEQLQMRMGDIEVVLEPADSIPRTASGKFRAVISQLTPDEKAQALGKRS